MYVDADSLSRRRVVAETKMVVRGDAVSRHSGMIQENRPIQLTLRSVLLAVAGFGVVFGVARAFSGFVAILALFGLMFVTLLARGGSRHLACADGVILMGGGVITVSAFFAFGLGPMGGAIRYSDLLQNVRFSVVGMSWMLVVWPVGYGLLSACLAFLVMIARDMRAGLETLRWRVLLLLLVTVSTTHWLLVGLQWSPVSNGPRMLSVLLLSASFAFALSLASVALCCFRQAVSRSAAMHVILSLLAYSYFGLRLAPTSESVATFLCTYGPGCWLLLLGNLCILGAALRLACKEWRGRDQGAPA